MSTDAQWEEYLRQYTVRRNALLRHLRSPHLARVPFHKCLIGYPGVSTAAVLLEELDPEGNLCGVWAVATGAVGFGSAAEAVRAALGSAKDDGWPEAVERAVHRERRWSPPYRRPWVEVGQSDQTLIHITAAVNRESILRHGLDRHRMGLARGIAGSGGPEMEAVFLCSPESIDFYAGMSLVPSDVWEVRVDGLWIETAPDGWWITGEPISADRLRLLQANRPARSGEGGPTPDGDQGRARRARKPRSNSAQPLPP